jgi:(2Fe-2S) ferredoxin
MRAEYLFSQSTDSGRIIEKHASEGEYVSEEVKPLPFA